MSYRFQALNPMLHTLDMEKTIAWYTSVLGFRCSAQADDWCRLQRDEVALMFMCNGHFGSPGVTATQYIYVDDVRGLWAAVKDRVTPEWGPEEMPYGLFEFAIMDPNGYLLSFGQTVGPASEHGS
jgi:catechol 2,3-dioxygenase-like lactoylglutathione lyase family enzyme